MSTALLRADKLVCERDDRLLFSGLSFELSSGDVLQLEGPNGAGKTTLLRVLSGLFSNFEGQVSWKGRDVRECYSEFQQDLLFIGHKSSVKTTLTPLENLRFLMGLQQSVFEGDLWRALEQVGLAGYEHVLCRNLSAGQKRRVALARLYLSKARVWVLDEIFTAIDKKGVAQLEALLVEKAKNGVAIVLTTHHELAIPSVKVLRLGQVNA
ncbi:MAG: heme exporter protein A [Oleiphilaceae bacterium]|jgi:heme exporter protein A